MISAVLTLLKILFIVFAAVLFTAEIDKLFSSRSIRYTKIKYEIERVLLYTGYPILIIIIWMQSAGIIDLVGSENLVKANLVMVYLLFTQALTVRFIFRQPPEKEASQ